MKTEVSKAILGQMTSREATEAVVEEVAVKYGMWLREIMYAHGDGKIRVKPDMLPEEMMGRGKINTKELYTYWIDNIYKSDK